MKPRSLLLMAVLSLAGVMLGGCSMPRPRPPFVPPANVPNVVPQVPLANNIVHVAGSPIAAPPGVSRTIHVWVSTRQAFQGESSGPTGLSSVNITYGGNTIGTVALNPNQPSAHGSFQWTPPEIPADYYIQADAGAPSIPDGRSVLGATLCVDDLGLTIGELVEPGRLVCAMLPRPGRTLPFRITHADAHARMSCNTSGLQFDITVDDPSRQVYYAFADLPNLGTGGMHTYDTAGPGPALYSLVIPWNTADLLSQLAGAGTITWTAGAVDHSGQVVLDGPHQFAITVPTDCINLPRVAVPLIPRIPHLGPYLEPALPFDFFAADTPTSTVPPSASACPAGTYYAPASSSCTKIATAIPKPTGKPLSCKKFKDPSSCSANGCDWDKATGKCS